MGKLSQYMHVQLWQRTLQVRLQHLSEALPLPACQIREHDRLPDGCHDLFALGSACTAPGLSLTLQVCKHACLKLTWASMKAALPQCAFTRTTFSRQQ